MPSSSGQATAASAALVARSGPPACAGELPVAYVQLKPVASVSADELLDHVRQHTPERAVVPVAIYFVEALPLTAVGKVYKPALRWAAAQRKVTQLLAGLAPTGTALGVTVAAATVPGVGAKTSWCAWLHRCPVWRVAWSPSL